MDFGSLERRADGYVMCITTQALEAFCSLCHQDVVLTGLQEAEGRLAVMREIHKLFRWYAPNEIECKVMKGTHADEAAVRWSHRGVPLVDYLTVSPDTGEIVEIRRARDGVLPELASSFPAPQSLKALGQGWAELASLIRGPKTVTTTTMCTPRRHHFLNRSMPVPKATFNGSVSSPAKSLIAISPRTPGLVPAPPSTASRAAVPETLRRPVLDFSFKEISSLRQLFSTEPRSGVRHRPRVPQQPVPVKVEPVVQEPRQVLEEEELILVKAKSKDSGQELAYQWDKNEKGHEEMREELAALLPPVPAVPGSTPERPNITRYVTSAVKLSNNQLSDTALLTRALKMLVRHSVLHLTFIDLSCNCISVLPRDLEDLPLQVLYLHSNNITSFEQVKKLSNISTLHSLTLWNNPIENASAGTYKVHVLYLLSSVFRGRSQIRKLDHVTLSKQDVQNCRMFEDFTIVAAENNKRRALMM